MVVATKNKPGRKKTKFDLPKKKSTYGGAGRGQGRKKGARNRLTEEAIAAAKATGELPLDYMLRVMRDEAQPSDRRDAMAIAAAPYLHARLTVTKLQSSGGIAIRLDYDDEKL